MLKVLYQIAIDIIDNILQLDSKALQKLIKLMKRRRTKMFITEKKKTASVFTRVSPELKEQAEAVLNQLQIPMSTALNMFLEQIVIQQGIPFDIKLHHPTVDYRYLPQEQFDSKIAEGLADIQAGRAYTASQIRDEFNKKS
jgi:addiction module RelB/DinJ family antitoxin